MSGGLELGAGVGLLGMALALCGPGRAAPNAARRLARASTARAAAARVGGGSRATTARVAQGARSTGARIGEGWRGGPLLAGLVAAVFVLGVVGLSPAGCGAALVISLLCIGGMRRSAAAAAGRRASLDIADLPLFLDVIATQLRAGAPIALALQRAGPVAPSSTLPVLTEVSAMLRLGAPPADAWRGAAGTALADFAGLACRSADNGAQLADQAVRLAAEVRAHRVAVMEGAARQAGVWAMAPLGLCFLPAFVCLGVGPVVLGLVGAALGGAGMPAAP